jgi:nucleotide-binding universal stress UspA family protein
MKATNIKRILVPTDFSETGSLAFDHAVFMARLYKAELHLVHVIEVIDATYSIYNPAIPVIDISVIESNCKDRLTQMKVELKKKHSITAHTYVLHGRPEQAVLDLVESKDIVFHRQQCASCCDNLSLPCNYSAEAREETWIH